MMSLDEIVAWIFEPEQHETLDALADNLNAGQAPADALEHAFAEMQEAAEDRDRIAARMPANIRDAGEDAQRRYARHAIRRIQRAARGEIQAVTTPRRTFTPQRAAQVLARLRPGVRYQLIVSFMMPDGTMERNNAPLRYVGDAAYVTQATEARVLVGVDERFFEKKGNEYRPAIFYRFVPIPNAGPDAIGGMRAAEELADPRLNCVVAGVREAFAKSTRSKLTAANQRFLDAFNDRVLASGCKLSDLPDLEKALRIQLVVRSILGDVIFASGKYQERKRIEIVAHQEHAWFAGFPSFPRKITSVVTYGAGVELKQAEVLAAKCLELAKAEGARRVFMLGPMAFVTDEGKMVKPAAVQSALQNFVDLTFDRQNYPLREELDYTHPDNVRHFSAYRGYEESTWMCASELTAWFSYWREKMGITPTSNARRAAWKNACVEHRVWNSTEPAPADLVQLDTVACFPSFAVAPDAREWFKRYGLVVTDAAQEVAINGPVDVGHALLECNGAAEVVQWELSDAVHPYVSGLLANHLEQRGWLPIPLLAWALTRRVLLRCSVRSAMLAAGSQKVTFPGGKEMARKLLGNLTKNSRQQSMFLSDPGEADYLVNYLAGKGRLIRWDRVGRSTVIHYCDGEKVARPSYRHVRASFLCFVHIAMMEQLLRVPAADVYCVVTDAIFIRARSVDSCSHVVAANSTEPGCWRPKGEGRYPVVQSQQWSHADKYVCAAEFEPRTGVPTMNDPILRYQSCYLYGQGGSGKTTRAIQLYRHIPGLVVLTPSNDLAREHREKHGFDKKQCLTFHKWFKLSATQTVATWSPEKLGMRARPSVVIWDEACFVGTKTLRPLVAYLRSINVRVVLCGDPGQLAPFEDKRGPHEWIMRNTEYQEQIMSDYRARDERLRALKVAMYMQPHSEQIAQMRSAVPAVSVDNMLTEWKPSDVVLVPTNAILAQLSQRMLTVHAQKYPLEPVPIVYTPVDGRIQNVQITPPGHAVPIEVCRGTTVTTTLAAARELPQFWALGYAFTVHRAQGRTIENSRLWIVDAHLGSWNENAAYTAVSRACNFEQLRLVTIDHTPTTPGDENPVWVREKIGRKLLAYARNDMDRGLAFDLTVEAVLAMRESQQNACAVCTDPLLWQYATLDPQQFSVDRLNDDLGHTAANCRLTCLRCNRNHHK